MQHYYMLLHAEYYDIQVKAICDFLLQSKAITTAYTLKFFAIEFLNFVIVVLQIMSTKRLLDGQFQLFSTTSRMAKIFPKATTCFVHTYGHSGTLQSFSTLSHVPSSFVNEKIFLLLSYWFGFLVFTNGLKVAYRFLILASEKFRFFMLFKTLWFRQRKDVELLSRKLSIGQLFFLALLSGSVIPSVLKKIISSLITENQSDSNTEDEITSCLIV